MRVLLQENTYLYRQLLDECSIAFSYLRIKGVIGQNVCLDLGVDAGQLPFFLKFLLLKQKFTRTKCVSGLL